MSKASDLREHQAQAEVLFRYDHGKLDLNGINGKFDVDDHRNDDGAHLGKSGSRKLPALPLLLADELLELGTARRSTA